MQAARDRRKSYADLKRKPMKFQVGDKVMLKFRFGKGSVHNTFHVSNLKKCHADEPLAVPLDGLHLDGKLHFVEKPVENVDLEVKRLKRSRIPLVKVRWNSKRDKYIVDEDYYKLIQVRLAHSVNEVHEYRRRCPIFNGFDLGGIHMNTLTVDHVIEELYFGNLKFTLGKFGIQLLFLNNTPRTRYSAATQFGGVTENINWDDVIEQVKRKEKEDNAVLRYQALKRKSQTKAQARKNMMVYLKNMAGFKMDFFRGMSYDDIRPIFKKYFNSNVAFLEKDKKELEEEASKALKRKSESSDFGFYAVEDFKEYTLKDYYCWYKLKLLDNAADSRLKLLKESGAADDKMKKYQHYLSGDDPSKRACISICSEDMSYRFPAISNISVNYTSFDLLDSVELLTPVEGDT
nr:hypothetical protein [Tanacetum cinerariifolium]